MKEIFLTQGKVTFVDDTDYDWLNQWKWYAFRNSKGNYHATRGISINVGVRTIYMSREILGLKRGDKRQADHENHNTLDNRRDNIRICTNQENNFNRKSNQKTSSRFKGVCWHKRDRRWQAYIHINGRAKYLGGYNTEENTAQAYNTAAKKYFGEFAYLNNIT